MIAAFITCLLSAAGIGAGLYFFHSGWTAILLYHGVLAGALTLQKPRWEGAHTILRGYNTAAAVVLVLLSAGFGWAFYMFIHRLDPEGVHVLRRVSHSGLTISGLALFAVYVSVVNPVLEELYWRRNYAAPHGVVFDGFYALLHLPIFCFFGNFTPLQLFLPVGGLVLAGSLWRGVARRRNGLASAILGHASGDLAVMVAIGLLLR